MEEVFDFALGEPTTQNVVLHPRPKFVNRNAHYLYETNHDVRTARTENTVR